MMKKLLIAPVLMLPLWAGSCSKSRAGSVKLAVDTDSVAYVIGMNIGRNPPAHGLDDSCRGRLRGIRDVFRGKTRLTDEEARTFYLAYVTTCFLEKARAYEEERARLADMAKSKSPVCSARARALPTR